MNNTVCDTSGTALALAEKIPYIIPMKIADVKLVSPVVMAPIAGMTDNPYRHIVMGYGAGLTVTELISANALVRDSRRTFEMLPRDDEPHPVACQIFGAEPDVMADAARIVEEKTNCDIIDLNYGCPVKKVTKCGAGSSMLKDLKNAEAVAKAVVSAVKKPVTVKIRIGWDKQSIVAEELARALESAGVAAIAVHGRTASQGYSGVADWDVISKVARAVKIPVIGNGDIDTPEKAKTRLETSGCAMIMIGRGALGAPWIFRQINELLGAGSYTPVTRAEKGETLLRHINLMVAHYGETPAIKMMRAHVGYYTRGMPGGSKFRQAANHITIAEELGALVREFFIITSSPIFDRDDNK